MGFLKQEYWSELSSPFPGDLPDPGLEPGSPVSPPSQAGSLPAVPLGKPKNHLEETSSASFAYLFTGGSSSSLLAWNSRGGNFHSCISVKLRVASSYDTATWCAFLGSERSWIALSESVDRSVVSDSSVTPRTLACQAPLSMGFSRQKLEWVAISFSRGIFPTQGSNPSLLPYRQILYHLSHQGSLNCPQSLSLFQVWGSESMQSWICLYPRV